MEFTGFLWDVFMNFLIIVSGGTILVTFVAARYYKKTSSDRAFVRTGAGGNIVIFDGGAIVLPLFQKLTWVDLSLRKIDVIILKDELVKTKDNILVSARCSFYVKVETHIGQILAASRTIGNLSKEEFSNYILSKFKSRLISVISELNYEEISSNSEKFKNKLSKSLFECLSLNGLTIESVDLTNFVPISINEIKENSVLNMETVYEMTKKISKLKLERKKLECNTKTEMFKEEKKIRELNFNEALKSI